MSNESSTSPETSTTEVAASPESASQAPVHSPGVQAAPAIPEAAVQWSELGLDPKILALIEAANFKAPTPVQAKAIPLAIEGKDLIVSAQTGTGKTAAFVLPLVEKLKGREGTYGLILAPSREVAIQIQVVLNSFAAPMGVRSAVLIGGIDMRVDTQALNTYPQVIVATPGRLCDHLDRGNIWLDYLEFVILDEADRMLDMGFSEQLNRIMTDTPASRQTMFFSATFAPPVEKLARRILRDPVRVQIGKPTSPAKTVHQHFIFTKEEAKIGVVLRLLRQEPGSVFIFTSSKEGATRLWRSLRSRGFDDATHLHSDLRQRDREQALEDFKQGRYRVIIATDVIGRGIHVDGVAHVVNYDMPREADDYIHRIGRTGRADAKGKATSLITSRDRLVISKIEKLIGKQIRPPAEALSALTSNAPSTSAPRGHSSPRPATPRNSAPRPAVPAQQPLDPNRPRIVIKPRSEQSPPPAEGGTIASAASNDVETAAGDSVDRGEKNASDGNGKRRRRRGGRGRGPRRDQEGSSTNVGEDSDSNSAVESSESSSSSSEP